MIYYLGDKTILYLIFNRIYCFTGVQNGKAEQPVWTPTANGANKKLVLLVQLRCGSLSITTPVSHLENELIFEANCTGKWAWQLLLIRLQAVAKFQRFIKGLLWKCKYYTMNSISGATGKPVCLTLCLLGIFFMLFSLLLFSSKSAFSKNNFCNTVRVSNSLDPDQAWSES